jgi:hypothetical protein
MTPRTKETVTAHTATYNTQKEKVVDDVPRVELGPPGYGEYNARRPVSE